MNPEEAYQVLKEDLDLDSENLREAYQITVDMPEEYTIVVEDNYNKIKSSIEVGQSPLALGELVRQFFNATHRNIDGEIFNLIETDFCEKLGEIASESLKQLAIINQMTEEMAEVKLSCDSTADMSYI